MIFIYNLCTIKQPKPFLVWQSSPKHILSWTWMFFLPLVVLLTTSTQLAAQCGEPECLPATDRNGPNPCMAKLYCSNSGNVQGLVACTNSADTDGCGIDRTECGPNGAGPNCAPVTSPVPQDIINTYFVTPGVPLNCYRSGTNGTGPVYNYVQWIKFATPENVTGLKIQGVGGSNLKSWVLFYAGSDTYGIGDPVDFPACTNNMLPLTFFGACSSQNQWYTWSNPNAVVGNGIANIYYIAFFYDSPGNGSLNFKAKNCTFAQSCTPLNGVIAGPSTVCPNSTNTYTAPAAPTGSTYAWSVTGAGTIPGPLDGPTVNVVAGSTCNGTYTVYLTITNGNCSYQFESEVSVIDDSDPTIGTPASDETVECDGAGNVAALNAWLASHGGAIATDACSGVTWTNNFTSLSDLCGATGAATVIFTATDACGNAATTTATFTIEDTTDPNIGTPASDETVECDGAGNVAALNAWLASHGGASATDVCSGVTWTNNFTGLSDLCGATGAATVIFTATDACGNAATTTATFTIEDTTDPTIGTPASDETVECDGAGNVAALNAWLASHGGASATDACSGVTWTNNFTGLSDLCGATGAATVIFTATDACGNASTTTATFTIEDTQGPTCPTPPLSFSQMSCLNSIPCPAIALAWMQANISDNCTTNNADIMVELTDDTGLPTCSNGVFSRTYTFKVTDACGNASTCSVTYSGTCQELCTFTQGGWGQAGGAPGTVFGTTDLVLIGNLLTANGGVLQIGTPTNGKYLNIYSATCVQTLLPGGGPPAVLKSFGGSSCNYNQALKNGKLNNVLASQTIALTLNIWLSGSSYQPGKNLGAESLDCIPGIPADVLAKLGANKTVAGLLALTNKFLGGENTSPVGASSLNTAVTIINERWDNCVQPIGTCSNTPQMLTGADIGNPTFHAWINDDHKVNLRWFIRNSGEVERFVVLRSTKDVEYANIAELKPTESIDLVNYVALDSHPKKGFNRYQLVIYLKNGQVEMMPEVEINMPNSKPFKLMPNPAKSEAWVDLTQLTKEKDVTVIISNCYGQQVLRLQIDEVVDDYPRLDLSNLGDGIYFVSVKVGREIYTDKLIITNTDR